MDKDLARIKEKLDIDEENSSENELKDDGSSRVLIRGESAEFQERSNSQNSNNFFDLIRASRSQTACCMFLVIISVVIIVILIFAHQEFEIIEEKHHHHRKPAA